MILNQTWINKLYCDRMDKRNQETKRIDRIIYNKELKDTITELEDLCVSNTTDMCQI